jgi:nucleotide-binding universal stress UspA family protein
MKLIAALDNSLAAGPVLSTAVALGKLLGAEVVALHIPADGDRTARIAAEAAGLELQTPAGPVVDSLIEIGRSSDVFAIVLGARGTPAGRRPLGSTALAVATSLPKPVVVVPPDARSPGELRRVLVPLEGTLSATLTPREIIRLADQSELEVILLHVLEEKSLPAFTDQPQHEHRAWAVEFVRRYSPWGIGRVRLETRVGRTEDLIPLVAEEAGVDLIALGWAQELAEGRARIVRATLGHCRVPVMLVPVSLPTGAAASTVPKTAART